MTDDVDDFLAHYGIKGMKWGQKKASIPGVSAKTSREARKDATEFAKAKMFYGEGAGTRRKLIKAKVEAKAGKDPNYKNPYIRAAATKAGKATYATIKDSGLVDKGASFVKNAFGK
jgi:hypothetical protein